MRGARAWAACVSVLLALSGCSREDDRQPMSAPQAEPIPVATGAPGEPVSLSHEAHAGDVVQVWVQPLPAQTCPLEFTIESPSGRTADATTHDPMRRLDEDGTWTWTYTPCPDDKGAYSLRARPTQVRALAAGDTAVQLRSDTDVAQAATFEIPAEGRALLQGDWFALIGPTGERVFSAPSATGATVFEDGHLLAPMVPEAESDGSHTYTVIGADTGSEVRLVEPEEMDGTVDGEPLALDGGAAEYDVRFSVDEDTWMTTPLRDWSAQGDQPGASVEVVPVTEDAPDPRRVGSSDGLWHLKSGEYVARVTPLDAQDQGTLALTQLTPTTITRAGRHVLHTGPDGEPTVALLDLPRGMPITVPGGPLRARPWLLAWSQDEPPPACVSALSCMVASAQATIPLSEQARSMNWQPSVGADDYLVLSGRGEHAVPVTLGRH